MPNGIITSQGWTQSKQIIAYPDGQFAGYVSSYQFDYAAPSGNEDSLINNLKPGDLIYLSAPGKVKKIKANTSNTTLRNTRFGIVLSIKDESGNWFTEKDFSETGGIVTVMDYRNIEWFGSEVTIHSENAGSADTRIPFNFDVHAAGSGPLDGLIASVGKVADKNIYAFKMKNGGSVTPAPQTRSYSFSITSATVEEGPAVTYNLSVQLVTSNGQPTTTAGSVQVALTGGTGSSADLVGWTTQTLNWSIGDADGTVKNVSLVLNDDALAEGSETLVFTLQTPTNGTVGTNGTFTLGINPSDQSGGGSQTASVQLQSSSGSIIEGGSQDITAVLTTSDGLALVNPVTVQLARTGGTGNSSEISGASLPRTLTFNAGSLNSATQSTTINITDDATVGNNRTHIFSLQSPSGANLGASIQYTLSVADNDSVYPSSVSEVHILGIYGQSHFLAFQPTSGSSSVLTTTTESSVKMLNGGIAPVAGGTGNGTIAPDLSTTGATSLVSAAEFDYTSAIPMFNLSSGRVSETGWLHFCNKAHNDTDINPNPAAPVTGFLPIMFGRGSTPVTSGNPNLSKSDTTNRWYAEFVEIMNAAKALVIAQGKTPRISIFFSTGGAERNEAIPNYTNAIIQLKNDLKTDVDANLKFITIQSSHEIFSFSTTESSAATQQLDADIADAEVIVADSREDMGFASDNLHYTGTEYRKQAEKMYKAWKTLWINNQDYTAPRLSSASMVGTTLEAVIGGVSTNLVIDTTTIPDQGNGKGFRLFDGTNPATDTELTINNVSVDNTSSPRKVIITTASAGTASTKTLCVASRGTGGSRPRPNVRDSRSTLFPSTLSGFANNNFLLKQEISVPYTPPGGLQTRSVAFGTPNTIYTKEGQTNLNVPVVLTTSDGLASTLAVSVDITVTGGTGSAGDITIGTGTVTFSAGSANGAIQNAVISIVSAVSDEPDETVTLGLTNVSNASITAGSYTVNIAADIPSTAGVRFFDTFTDANGTSLASHTPDLPVSGSGAKLVYFGASSADIQNGGLQHASSGQSAAGAGGSVNTGALDGYIEAVFTPSGSDNTQYHAVGNYFVDASNYWTASFRVSDGDFALFRRRGGNTEVLAGTGTQIGAVQASARTTISGLTAGQQYRLRLTTSNSGNDFTAQIYAVNAHGSFTAGQLIATVTATGITALPNHSTFAASTSQLVRLREANSRLDNVLAGA